MTEDKDVIGRFKDLEHVSMPEQDFEQVWSVVRTELRARKTSAFPAKKRWLTSGAAFAAGIVVIVGVIYGIHRNVIVQGRGPDVTAAANTSHQNNVNGTSVTHPTHPSNTVVPDGTTATMQAYYAQNDDKVIKVHSYPQYHAAIVKSHINETTTPLPNDFTWWDLKTGTHFLLAGRPDYVQLKKVVGPKKVVFLATGKNDIASTTSFPYYIVAQRNTLNSSFKTVNKPAYLPVSESTTFGDFKTEAVSGITASSPAVKINFGPQPGESQGAFAAGSYGAPNTKINYDTSQHELILSFTKTKAGISNAKLNSVHNGFVTRVTTQTNGANLQVVLKLTSVARYYSVSVTHTQNPSMTVAFATKSPQP